jgi:hypothetical protein
MLLALKTDDKNKQPIKYMKKIMLIGLTILAVSNMALMACTFGAADPAKNCYCNPPDDLRECITVCDWSYMCKVQSYCYNAPLPPLCYASAEVEWFTCNASCVF